MNKRPNTNSHTDRKKRVKFSDENKTTLIETNYESQEEDFELERPSRKFRLKVDDGDVESDVDAASDDEVLSDDEHPKVPKKDKRLFDVESDVEEEDPDDAETEVPIEPFNMRNELQEGHFEDGMYVLDRDEDKQHDSWLSGLSKKDMQRAAQAHRKREKMVENDRKLEQPVNQKELIKNLLKFLEPNETVLQAMKRFGGNQSNRRKRTEKDDPESKERRQKISELTEIADKLLNAGYLNVYEDNFERFSQIVNPPTTMWQYRWEEGGEIFGPYGLAQMRDWKNAGFFTGNSIQIRKVTRTTSGAVTMSQFEPLANQLE